jgi:hypothetical protein
MLQRSQSFRKSAKSDQKSLLKQALSGQGSSPHVWARPIFLHAFGLRA